MFLPYWAHQRNRFTVTSISLTVLYLLLVARERFMVSDSTTKMRRYEGRETNEAMESLLLKISQLKKQIEAARVASIKEKCRKNVVNVDLTTSQLCELSKSMKNIHLEDQTGSRNMLSFRIENPLFQHRYAHGLGEKDSINNQEASPTPIIKLPCVERIPPYTTWVYLDKNRRMPEEQSVVGRRQIYYDQSGGEALISSDSDEEIAESEEAIAKHEFSEGEDQMLRTILQEHGLTEEVLDVLTQYIRAPSSAIKERYTNLCEKSLKDSRGNLYEVGIDMETSLESALESVDNLFCRRCLVFDCRLHGYNQNIVVPNEKQPQFNEVGESGKPCSDQCYLWSRKQVEDICGSKSIPSVSCSDKRINGNSLETAIPKVYDGPANESTPAVPSNEISVMPKAKKGEVEGALSGCEWRPLERDLYLKGIEIFGKNSCLITRNLLSGLKTCMEVYTYMFKGADSMIQSCAAFSNSRLEDNGTDDNNHTELEIPSRSRLFRKRGRARKLKYTWKSSGHPSIRKRIADGKSRLRKTYTPCECQSTCGKQCSCMVNGTCCEKYCGCTKSCKNRFRGCHCAKSQCRSRQCPCFAANRECDPDVCRNCWVSCGDGSLGETPARGDGYQCGNMNLLLKQRKKILLAKSSVAGWGAFIKNPVNKNDYLGEYTGEIIGHKEADKRGKIYDRANSSFLFDLDQECVLDAFRKGDKLKFANHSSAPNCFAKVMMVAGDHRVGIFAKERIDPGEELFYDYFYGPDQAPPWAWKPEWSKRDDSSAPRGRACKHQSH